MQTFDSLSRSISRSALLVSPFISLEPLQHLSSILNKRTAVTVQILTSLNVDNLIQGTTDVGAIASFCRMIPSTTVRHLPRLHAKVYIADDRLAILTSANLTEAGLNQNYEYGIEITDPILVSKISEDLKAYRDLGVEVSLLELEQLTEISHELQERQAQVLRSARQALRQEFKRKVEVATEAVMYLRAKPGETTNKIFSRTILYLLRNGPISTQQMHPLIQRIHPDLCDDSIDRVIRGVHFGKRWKHMLRNAQQSLKNTELIRFDGRKWHLFKTN
jgi:hypothetical protein